MKFSVVRVQSVTGMNKATMLYSYSTVSVMVFVWALIFLVPSVLSSSEDAFFEMEVPIVLKKCSTSNMKSIPGNSTQLPVFSSRTMLYDLQTIFINNDETFHACPDGQPFLSNITRTVPKEHFDSDIYDENGEFNVATMFEALRSVTLLLTNGYLSEGNAEILTAVYYSPDEYCIDDLNNEDGVLSAVFRLCYRSSARPILRKCCPLGMMWNSTTCVDYPLDEPAWDPEYFDAKTMKRLSLNKANPVIHSPDLPCGEADTIEEWIPDNCTHEFHPVTDNRVAFVGAYRSWEFITPDVDLCIDLSNPANGMRNLIMFHCVPNNTAGENKQIRARISMAYMITMYIGAFFHVLTTTTYLLTWPKQNIHGKTLCSCTASLLFMQLFLGTAHLLGHLQTSRNSGECIFNAIGGQYFMIAAFTWLLVVNVDLWRTFRSLKAPGSKHKRFIAYSGFAWGFPLCVTLISIALEFTFKCRVSGVPVPEYGEHYCFIAPWAQGYYVYYILSFLIALVFFFAGLTLFGLYMFKKDTGNLRSNKQADDSQNILLFLKLTVVMGLTWIFEVISWAVTKENEDNNIGWVVLDLYNTLSAILIFIIFVCKRSTLNMLEQSVPMLEGLTAAILKLSSTFSRESYSDNTNSTVLSSTARKDSSQSRRHKRSIDEPSVVFTKTGGVNEIAATTAP